MKSVSVVRQNRSEQCRQIGDVYRDWMMWLCGGPEPALGSLWTDFLSFKKWPKVGFHSQPQSCLSLFFNKLLLHLQCQACNSLHLLQGEDDGLSVYVTLRDHPQTLSQLTCAPGDNETLYFFLQIISLWINSCEWEITISFGFCLPDLTSIKWRSEALSIGVNPLYSSSSRRLNPRDFSPAALLSVCARLGMGDSVMDGSRQIHSSNELMNKYI